MKQILGIFLMILQSILGIIICLSIALVVNMNSDAALKAIYDAKYLETTSTAAKQTLEGYMSKEKAEEILNKVSVKSSIKELTLAMDNNTVEKKAEDIKENIKEKIILSLEDESSEDTKVQYAEVVANAYMKTIFPVSEMSLVSRIYTLYQNKIIFGVIVLALVYGIIYVFLSKGRKTYKWQIIAIYNSIIFLVIAFVMLGTVTGITIGNERTSVVITNMLTGIRMDVLLTVLGLLILAIFSNYIAYFRKKKKDSRK